MSSYFLWKIHVNYAGKHKVSCDDPMPADILVSNGKIYVVFNS
jgi:hypothetical protein